MQRTKPTGVPFPLPQQRILRALAEVGEATNMQLCRRWYKAGCIASIWRNIAALEREKLIAHKPRLLRQSADGPAQRLYFLTTAGERAVAALGVPIIRQRTKTGGSYIGQEHRQLVTDLWCAVHEWERESGGTVAIIEKIHDTALKTDPLLLTVDGRGVKSVPDAWFHLRVDGVDRRFWVEADRGTEDEEAAFRFKVRKIAIASRARKAQQKWGGGGFRALFIIHPLDPRRAQRRMERVLTWIEHELVAEGIAATYGPFFLVAAIDPAAVSGKSLFTAPSFVSPFARVPQAIMATPPA